LFAEVDGNSSETYRCLFSSFKANLNLFIFKVPDFGVERLKLINYKNAPSGFQPLSFFWILKHFVRSFKLEKIFYY